MLDRLKECLEAHQLPHYIMPQSNLLQYEDPASLKEAAVIVEDTRKTILSKTVVLLKRLQSMSYLSSTYLQDIGLHLESHLLSIQDENLPKKDQMVLLRSLHSVFASKCKEVLARLRRMQEHSNDVERMLNIAWNAYQSMLARNLCKLWFLSEDHREREEEFKIFVKEEVKDLSLDDDFLALAFVFFDRTKNGMEPSLAIPNTRAMQLMREEQTKIAEENVEEGKAQFKGILDWLKTDDLKSIVENTSKVFQANLGSSQAIITKEDMERVLNTQFAALFKERMEDNN